jgi:hypothetical protein
MSILWAICALLVAFWVLGLFMHIAGPVIHLLLVVAAVLFVINLVTGRRTTL